MDAIIIIPARYKSSRLPGKPLVNILGKTLILRVWEQCIKVLNPEYVYIATDDKRIKDHCIKHDMQYIMTSDDCLTGTDRVAEAYQKIGKKYATIINVQGDEPLIKPEDILAVAKAHIMFPKTICCGVSKIKTEEEFRNPNIIKIVTDQFGQLLYASRASIPTNKKLSFEQAHKQVCIYAFSPDSLVWFSSNKKKTLLESIEDIEFLRFLEMGFTIKMIDVSSSSIPVDIPEDIPKVEFALKEEK